MFAMAICAVAALWIAGWIRHRQARQQEWQPSNPSSVRVTVETGIPQHTFSYDGPAAAGRFESYNGNPTQDGNAVLQEVDRFHDMSSLRMSHARLDDESLRRLRSMDQLRSLRIEDSELPENIFQQLRPLKLERLDLVNCNITDPMLTGLADFRQLRILVLVDNQLSDRAFATFDRLENLEALDLRGNAMSTTAIEAFQRQHPSCQLKLDEAEEEQE